MPRMIRRYENRKLYDVEEKRYVSLQEIAVLVRAGQEVAVTDNVTGDDLTAQTLAKIIAEESTGTQAVSNILHEVVRWGGNVLHAGVDQVEGMLDRAVEASLQRLPSVQKLRAETEQLRTQLVRLEQALALAKEQNSTQAQQKNEDSAVTTPEP